MIIILFDIIERNINYSHLSLNFYNKIPYLYYFSLKILKEIKFYWKKSKKLWNLLKLKEFKEVSQHLYKITIKGLKNH